MTSIDSTVLYTLSNEIKRAVNQLDLLPEDPTLSMLSDIAGELERTSDRLRWLADQILQVERERSFAEEAAYHRSMKP